MPRRSLRVMKKQHSDTLPEWATEFVVLAADLEERGILSELDDRLRVSRRDGYCSLDVFLFLLAYFSSSLRIGLRAFAKRCAPHASKLAAVGGRRVWPSSSSVSRFLSSVTSEQVNEFGAWLLGAAVAAGQIESHPSIVCRDTQGEAWHAFDYDPTITTLRHRALPTDDDLPEPQRRSSEMAASGYRGRKRGDVQFSRATLQHAGSGLWLNVSATPGNGEHRRDYERAVSATKGWCKRTGVSLERAVLRSDGGAGGSVPAMTACRDADVQFVTRLSRYEVLERAQVKVRLNEAIWSKVQDSLSGPQREATDIGTMVLRPGHKVRRDNGEPYPSIQTRIVASRIAITDESSKRGAGIEKDGWWYELFGTSLPASSWPAPETVSLYYGRTGQENRFCQEDREFGLDRIFSYDLPGQQLANLVGLFVWNLRTARGADLVAPMPERLPVQPPRPLTQTATISTEDAGCPTFEVEQLKSEPAAVQSNTAEHADPQNEVTTLNPTVSVLPVKAPTNPSSASWEKPPNSSHIGSLSSPENFLGIDWNRHLAHLPDWQWDEKRGMICPHGALMRVRSIANVVDQTLLVVFRSTQRACRDCPLRPVCSRSQSVFFRKQLAFNFDRNESASIAALAAVAKPAPVAHVKGVAELRPKTSHAPWRPTPGEREPGTRAISSPILVPSALRHHFSSTCHEARAEVKVQALRTKTTRVPFYIAKTDADRQQRRKTWTWRRNLNQLPEDAHVDITLHGSTRLTRLFAADNNLRKAA